MKRLLYLGIALFLIVFEAVPEGLALGGHKMIAGIIEFVYLAGVTLTVFAYFTKSYPLSKWQYYRGYKTLYDMDERAFPPFWQYIIGYLLLRIAIFDIIFNLSAGLDPFYIVSTKLFDIIASELGSWGWFMRFVLGLTGLAWILRK